MSTARAERLKVFLDTNVYFSAFCGKGVPSRIWQFALRKEYILLVSPPIVSEIAEVFRRELNWPDNEIIALVKLIAKVAKIIVPTINLRAVRELYLSGHVHHDRSGTQSRQILRKLALALDSS